jgi:hypothetical protein
MSSIKGRGFHFNLDKLDNIDIAQSLAQTHLNRKHGTNKEGAEPVNSEEVVEKYLSSPESGEQALFADLVKNQLISDTGGHTVINSNVDSDEQITEQTIVNAAPSNASTQASTNQANESRLLEANLAKEAQHAAQKPVLNLSLLS